MRSEGARRQSHVAQSTLIHQMVDNPLDLIIPSHHLTNGSVTAPRRLLRRRHPNFTSRPHPTAAGKHTHPPKNAGAPSAVARSAERCRESINGRMLGVSTGTLLHAAAARPLPPPLHQAPAPTPPLSPKGRTLRNRFRSAESMQGRPPPPSNWLLRGTGSSKPLLLQLPPGAAVAPTAAEAAAAVAVAVAAVACCCHSSRCRRPQLLPQQLPSLPRLQQQLLPPPLAPAAAAAACTPEPRPRRWGL